MLIPAISPHMYLIQHLSIVVINLILIFSRDTVAMLEATLELAVIIPSLILIKIATVLEQQVCL